MHPYRGLIRGFVAGVFLTLLLVGIGGYLFYQGLQEKLSPEQVRKVSEAALDRLLGQDVQVGGARVSPSGILVMNRVRVGSGSETILAVEKIQVYPESGVRDLQEGKFAQIVVTNPTLTLEKQNDHWNLEDFLSPIQKRLLSERETGRENEGEPTQEIPLNRVQITGLNLTVALKDISAYSALELENLILERQDTKSSWNLRVEGGKIRLNPSENTWPLFEAYEAIPPILAGTRTESGAESGKVEDNGKGAGFRLETVSLERTELDLVHSNQRITVEGISFLAKDFFQLIQLESGSPGEKKNLSPDV